MGQQQYRTGDDQKRQEKTAPIEKDRAVAKGFGRREDNNPALKFKESKPTPASRPV